MTSTEHRLADAPLPPAQIASRWRRLTDGWVRFRRNPLSVIGVVVVVAFLLTGLLADLIQPYPSFSLVGRRLQPPGADHWFGTDHLGRDIFSGVIAGTRTALIVGFLSSAFSVALGILVGAVAGYAGGRVDNILMRISEMFQVIPRFFLALVIVSLFGASLWGIVFVIGILSWPEIARLVRSEFLTLRQRPFVMAARVYGAGNTRIIFREILPNSLTPVIVAASLQIPAAIILEASLSFIGASDPSVMSWGRMLNAAQPYLRQAWWCAVFPGVAVSLLALALAVTSDGLNDFLNPRLRERR